MRHVLTVLAIVALALIGAPTASGDTRAETAAGPSGVAL